MNSTGTWSWQYLLKARLGSSASGNTRSLLISLPTVSSFFMHFFYPSLYPKAIRQLSSSVEYKCSVFNEVELRLDYINLSYEFGCRLFLFLQASGHIFILKTKCLVIRLNLGMSGFTR